MQRSVICVGAAVVDLVFQVEAIPIVPGKFQANSRVRRNGGPAGTGAVALSRLGMPAAFWGNVGKDADGEQVAAALELHGVDVRGLTFLDDAATVLAIVMTDPLGERLIVAHSADIFARPAGDLPLDSLHDAAAVLADSAWPGGSLAVLSAADAIGLPSVFDGEQSLPKETLLRLAGLSRLPVFCAEAFALLVGGAAPEAASVEGLSRQLGRDVGVTLGERGSIWWLDGRLLEVPALNVVCRDTTGAGDVFHGALTGAIAEAMPIEQAIRFATVAAALKCQAGDGWNGMPDRAAVEQALSRLGARSVR